MNYPPSGLPRHFVPRSDDNWEGHRDDDEKETAKDCFHPDGCRNDDEGDEADNSEIATPPAGVRDDDKRKKGIAMTKK